MTTVKEDGGRENIYAIEPPMEIIEVNEDHATKAERLNGRLAMLGFVAAVISYVATGKLVFGVY